jgi:hypothetical protein
MSSDFVIGRYLPNFDLKNMISIHTKDFSMEKMAQFCQMLRFFFLDCQNFMITSNSNGQIWLLFFFPHLIATLATSQN